MSAFSLIDNLIYIYAYYSMHLDEAIQIYSPVSLRLSPKDFES